MSTTLPEKDVHNPHVLLGPALAGVLRSWKQSANLFGQVLARGVPCRGTAHRWAVDRAAGARHQRWAGGRGGQVAVSRLHVHPRRPRLRWYAGDAPLRFDRGPLPGRRAEGDPQHLCRLPKSRWFRPVHQGGRCLCASPLRRQPNPRHRPPGVGDAGVGQLRHGDAARPRHSQPHCCGWRGGNGCWLGEPQRTRPPSHRIATGILDAEIRQFVPLGNRRRLQFRCALLHSKHHAGSRDLRGRQRRPHVRASRRHRLPGGHQQFRRELLFK